MIFLVLFLHIQHYSYVHTYVQGSLYSIAMHLDVCMAYNVFGFVSASGKESRESSPVQAPLLSTQVIYDTSLC